MRADSKGAEFGLQAGAEVSEDALAGSHRLDHHQEAASNTRHALPRKVAKRQASSLFFLCERRPRRVRQKKQSH